MSQNTEYTVDPSRLVSPDAAPADAAEEVSLRPKTLDDYIGQEKAKNNLRIYLRAAQQRAAEITAAAQSESRTLRQTVTDYCDNMLKTTEEAMVENAAQVKNVRANLRQNAKKNG